MNCGRKHRMCRHRFLGHKPGRRLHPKKWRRATSPRNRLTCEKRRAPALTYGQNERRISAAPIALGERYEKGRRSLTSSSTRSSRQNSTRTASPPNDATARFVSPKIAWLPSPKRWNLRRNVPSSSQVFVFITQHTGEVSLRTKLCSSNRGIRLNCLKASLT